MSAEPQQKPERLFSRGNRLSNLLDLSSDCIPISVCVLLHAHKGVYLCASLNLKQVSVITSAETLAQRELIIHTVTLFTVALWSFHFSLSLLFSPPPPSLPMPLGNTLQSFSKKLSSLCCETGFGSLSGGYMCMPGGSQARLRKVTFIIAKPLMLLSLGGYCKFCAK